MTILLVVSAVVVLALLLVPLSSVTVHFRLQRRGEDDRITFTVAWLKYIRYSVDVPLVDLMVRAKKSEIRLKAAAGPPETVSRSVAEETRVPVAFLWDSYHKFRHYTFVLWYLAGRTRISRFRWHSEIGVGEAHHTGLAAGLAWSLKSALVTGLYAYTVPLGKPDLAVRPNYRQSRLNTLLDCVFEIRIGHLVFAGLKAIWANR